LAWLRHLERNMSFMVDLMQGQLRSTLECLQCGHSSRRFDPFLYLSLPVTGRMTQVLDALTKFLEEEMLVKDEQWHCDKCNQKVDAMKKIDLWKLPPVLVLHLKRFEFCSCTGEFKKIDTLLSAPLTLDLTPFCSSVQKEGARFEVACVANHFGGVGMGHYTATCRVPSPKSRIVENGTRSVVDGAADCEWYHFDDELVDPLMDSSAVIGPQAYVIFLVRGGEKGGGPARSCILPRQTVSAPEFWPHKVSRANSELADVLPGRVGKGAAVACVNPRSAVLLPESSIYTESSINMSCSKSSMLSQVQSRNLSLNLSHSPSIPDEGVAAAPVRSSRRWAWRRK